MLELIIVYLKEMALLNLFLLFILENSVIAILAVMIGLLAIKLFDKSKISPHPSIITSQEIFLAFSTIIFNSVITFIGLILWRHGLINFTNKTGFQAIIDTFSLLFLMDFAMYFFHRVAHNKFIFAMIHKLHHKYTNPHPLTLFILSPSEVLGFGFLWLFLICIHDWSWTGMIIYLILNVAFGTIGHLGVEPFPKYWLKLPVLKYISTSTFHFGHHDDKEYNYGFYTTIWDKLFKTLKPDYEKSFAEIKSPNTQQSNDILY